jgi:predicted dehydrogenase
VLGRGAQPVVLARRFDVAQDFSPSRRALLKGGTATGAALGISGIAAGFGAEAAADTARAPAGMAEPKGSMIGVPFEPRDVVRVGVIGLGNRGSGMARLWAQHPDVRVTAICDSRPERVESVAAQLRSMGQDPATYAGGDPSYDSAQAATERALADRDADLPYTELCARDDIDFVYSPTPWEWHFPVAMEAMRHGKHVGTEMPLSMEIEHLWALVATSERTRRHCFMMEQIVYSQNEMRILRMAHEGLFGELLHGAGAYNHDIRGLLFGLEGSYYPSNWRRLWHTRRDGCFYPMHGLAPIAACMDINRGDRFASLVSSSSPAKGLALYREEHAPPDHDSWGEEYVAGDRNITLVETALGRVIRVEHDVSHPHPYSRLNHLAGTRGIFEDFAGGAGTSGGGTRIYLEPDHSGHRWGSFDAYAGYDHWIWTDLDDPNVGHGGADSKEVWRFVQMMKQGLVPDHDVYDGAAWTAVNPLSTKSLERAGAPVQIPDFTGGHWREYRDGIDSPRPGEGSSGQAVA